jgi:two-component system chemotaxis response regulator CheY
VRALVIDDSKSIRSILSKILTEIGFAVEEASNGLEAIDLIKKGKVDIALVDWNMPEMNGYEFIQEVRKDNTFKSMLLMMVTTETAIDKVADALEAGANEYIMKPFTKEMIVEKLALMGLDVSSASN